MPPLPVNLSLVYLRLLSIQGNVMLLAGPGAAPVGMGWGTPVVMGRWAGTLMTPAGFSALPLMPRFMPYGPASDARLQALLYPPPPPPPPLLLL